MWIMWSSFPYPTFEWMAYALALRWTVSTSMDLYVMLAFGACQRPMSVFVNSAQWVLNADMVLTMVVMTVVYISSCCDDEAFQLITI